MLKAHFVPGIGSILTTAGSGAEKIHVPPWKMILTAHKVSVFFALSKERAFYLQFESAIRIYIL
jgi:hypothetical protein